MGNAAMENAAMENAAMENAAMDAPRGLLAVLSARSGSSFERFKIFAGPGPEIRTIIGVFSEKSGRPGMELIVRCTKADADLFWSTGLTERGPLLGRLSHQRNSAVVAANA